MAVAVHKLPARLETIAEEASSSLSSIGSTVRKGDENQTNYVAVNHGISLRAIHSHALHILIENLFPTKSLSTGDKHLALLSSLSNLKFTPEKISVVDGKLAVEGKWSANHTGALLGLPASETSVCFSTMLNLEFENNKVVRRFGKVDVSTLKKQISFSHDLRQQSRERRKSQPLLSAMLYAGL